MDDRAAEECAGKRQKIGSQGAGEDGTRRFHFQKTHGVGENLRTIPVPESSVLRCDVGRDVVSSVETTLPSGFTTSPIKKLVVAPLVTVVVAMCVTVLRFCLVPSFLKY